ncbi:hypothetical protein LSAT2_023452 [Lamellibrachia satsuma]|nr:hypothetical protein LSAT2_023452 [Lamellibrachia satsuma]
MVAILILAVKETTARRRRGHCKPNNTCAGHYTCLGRNQFCYDGFKGDDCKERDFNAPNDPFCPAIGPCKNGGTCWNKTCCCVQGYEGAICENDVMECLSAPCQNGGACRDDVGSYMCDCLEGFSGVDCELGKITIPMKTSVEQTAEPTIEPNRQAGSFKCPRNTGRYQNPADCTQFFRCVWNKVYRKQCSHGLYFDPSLQVCNWKMQVDPKYRANCRAPSHR